MQNQIKEKLLVFWSGGIKSALALHTIKANPQYEVVGLVTSLGQDSNAVPFHGIPDSLLIQQSKMLNIPLLRIFLPPNCPNSEYVARVNEMLLPFKKRGISAVVFGDTHLTDVRKFREEMFEAIGLHCIFPLWGKAPKDLYQEIFHLGYKALVTSVNLSSLDKSFLNCEFNQAFLDRLPSTFDQSSFHTFIIYGPAFKSRVAFSKAVAIEEGPYLVSLVKEP